MGSVLSGVFLQVSVPLTQSDLNNCNTTPKLLLPAPGVGKMYLFQQITYVYYYGTTNYSYDNSTPLQCWYTGGFTASPYQGAIDQGDQNLFYNVSFSSMQQSLPTSLWASFNSGQSFPQLKYMNNSSVSLLRYGSNSGYTGGDGTGLVVLYYSILDL